MTIVDSLKKFLTKLGGNPNELENNATSAEIIDAISEAYTDKEGTYTEVTPIGSEGTKIATITTNNTQHDIYAPKELPAVTSEDEGDVLGVNSSGEWVKTTPSGGSDDFIVTGTQTWNDELQEVRVTGVDKTVSDIITAYNSGKNVIGYFNDPFGDDPTAKLRWMCVKAHPDEQGNEDGDEILFLLVHTNGIYIKPDAISGHRENGWKSFTPYWQND